MKRCLIWAALACLSATAVPVHAQYPEKPIEIIVG